MCVMIYKCLATRYLSAIFCRAYFANAKKLGRRLNLMCGSRAAIHGDFYARTRRCEQPTLLVD